MKFICSDNRSLETQSNLAQSNRSNLFLNEPSLSLNESSLFLSDRGYLFGDGFFTTGIINNGALRHHECHVARLIESAKRLSFNQFNLKELTDQLTGFIKLIDFASIRITITRQQSKRGYAFSDSDSINVSFQLSDLIALPTQHCKLNFAQTPISVNPMFAGLKHLNRLDNVFAAKEISLPQQEMLLCDDDRVICGSRSNLFIYEKDCWLTPKLNKAGINGITRQRLLKNMQTNGIKFLESDIFKQQVINCEAAFVTNSLLGIWVASSIQTKNIPTIFSEKLKEQLTFER